MTSTRFSLTSAPQGLYDVSSVQLAPLGATLVLNDGREFMYARAGAAAAVNGRMYMQEVPTADLANMATTAAAAGVRVINVTPTGTAVLTANEAAEGYAVFVNNTAAVAHAGSTFKISSNPATVAATAFNVTLADGLWEAILATHTTTIIKHPCADVIISAGPITAALVGVALRDVAISSYGWFQRKGICGCLQDGTVVAGNIVATSDGIAGAVAPVTGTQAVDEFEVGQAVANTADADVAVICLNL